MEKGDVVIHKTFGQCSIRSIDDESVILRLHDGSMEECSIYDIKPMPKIDSAETPFSSLASLLKIDGALIESINNAWGIFSKTSIKLLPHQLWVCNRVMRQWPARMMIADDVGLGKTMEAGLIIRAAVSSGKAKRILILTPPKLVYQWQDRMNSFYLNFRVYSDYHSFKEDYLIAPISNLKLDTNGKHDKLLEQDAWDIVIVDEAHHAGASKQDHTLGYKLIEKLDKEGRIKSLLFFTATPHQGKDEDFWALMGLLDREAFSKNADERLNALHNYMIRNNKLSVMDMNGNKLFKGLTQHPKTYSYTKEESDFYWQMTDYIERGYAYASTLGNEEGRQVTLLLIALQKLASSSIAAIRMALSKRVLKLKEA